MARQREADPDHHQADKPSVKPLSEARTQVGAQDPRMHSYGLLTPTASYQQAINENGRADQGFALSARTASARALAMSLVGSRRTASS
jgi:hypothetical protein